MGTFDEELDREACGAPRGGNEVHAGGQCSARGGTVQRMNQPVVRRAACSLLQEFIPTVDLCADAGFNASPCTVRLELTLSALSAQFCVMDVDFALQQLLWIFHC